jgi:hypothetical protein
VFLIKIIFFCVAPFEDSGWNIVSIVAPGIAAFVTVALFSDAITVTRFIVRLGKGLFILSKHSIHCLFIFHINHLPMSCFLKTALFVSFLCFTKLYFMAEFS